METVTLTLPKKDVKTLLNILEDIRFLEKVEQGRREFREGRYLTYEEFRKKHLKD